MGTVTGPLLISKIVPAHTKTFEADWCMPDFIKMSDDFRKMRSGFKNKLDRCYWCQHSFVDGETIALAGTKTGNKVLCQTCNVNLCNSKPS